MKKWSKALAGMAMTILQRGQWPIRCRCAAWRRLVPLAMGPACGQQGMASLAGQPKKICSKDDSTLKTAEEVTRHCIMHVSSLKGYSSTT